jgi:hypothetical protein
LKRKKKIELRVDGKEQEIASAEGRGGGRR